MRLPPVANDFVSTYQIDKNCDARKPLKSTAVFYC